MQPARSPKGANVDCRLPHKLDGTVIGAVAHFTKEDVDWNEFYVHRIVWEHEIVHVPEISEYDPDTRTLKMDMVPQMCVPQMCVADMVRCK
jgi:hypothetical protein